MAKDQKRGNREAKKPKAIKAPIEASAATFGGKTGVAAQLGGGKKK